MEGLRIHPCEHGCIGRGGERGSDEVEIRLWIERCEPPAGTIGLDACSDPERFSGWLGLLKALDRLLAALPAHPVSEAGHELGPRSDA